MDLNIIKIYDKIGDIILIGGTSFISRLIGYGQKTQTKDGKPSKWSHVMLIYSPDTVWESTMDYKPYPTQLTENDDAGKRLDNGVQLNYLENHKDANPAMLLHFSFTDEQRQRLKNKMNEMLKKGYTYPISGLIGSLLSYWIFRGWKSNPLQSKSSLYCSAAIQEVYSVLGIDFDPMHTARNTSPEIISQFEYPEMEKIDVR